MPDEELARLCAAQVAGCMDELLARYEARVQACARRMALDRDQAEEAVQETFLRVVSSLASFQGRSAFSTWLYRLAHNTCIDLFRRGTRDARRQVPVAHGADSSVEDPLQALPAADGDPQAELDAQVQECYLGQALAKLPPSYREIVRLRLGEGRSSEEVARMLGTTVDAVKAKLRRARQQLRAILLERRECPICGRIGAFRVTQRGELD